MKIKIIILVSIITQHVISFEDIRISLFSKKSNSIYHLEQNFQQYEYEGESLNERIQRNTFSETASFTISSHLFATDDSDDIDNQSKYILQSITSRAYAAGDGDTPPGGWSDPNEPQKVPIGEIPWGLMSLLISISLFLTQRSRGSSLG